MSSVMAMSLIYMFVSCSRQIDSFTFHVVRRPSTDDVLLPVVTREEFPRDRTAISASMKLDFMVVSPDRTPRRRTCDVAVLPCERRLRTMRMRREDSSSGTRRTVIRWICRQKEAKVVLRTTNRMALEAIERRQRLLF